MLEQGFVAEHFDLGVVGIDSSGQYQEQVGGGVLIVSLSEVERT